MYSKKFIAACFCLLASCNAFGEKRFYGVAGIGIAETEVEQTSEQGASYRVGLGYELNKQWQFELGFQQLVDKYDDTLTEGLTSEAVTLSVLGKAANREGELFYRVGIAQIQLEGNVAGNSQGTCEVGSILTSTANTESGTLCYADEQVLGGVIGLGFDRYIGLHNMVRVEVEYLVGESSYSTASLYVGYRHNF